MTTIRELLGKAPMSSADKVALKIACEASSLVPMHIWASWPSHSMDQWRDQVASMVLKVLRDNNFREAGC